MRRWCRGSRVNVPNEPSIAAIDARRRAHASLMKVHAVALLIRALAVARWCVAAISFHTTSTRWWIGALAAAGLVGCALTPPAADGAETYVYHCDGEAAAVVVWLDGDRGHLFSRQASQPLRRQADGVSFAGTNVSYRPDRPPDLAPAQSAAISIGGKALRNCKNDRRAAVWEAAKLRGVSFRGVGQEPPWVLEIHRENGFLLVTDYGESRHSFPYSEPVSNAQQRSASYRSQAGGERIEITVTAESCRDSMSGESFASRVEIEWRGRLLRGCGRPLH